MQQGGDTMFNVGIRFDIISLIFFGEPKFPFLDNENEK